MYATMDDIYKGVDELSCDYIDRQRYIIDLNIKAHGPACLESAAMEGIISGTIAAINSFASTVWGILKGIKEMIFGKAESATKKLESAEEKISATDVNSALDAPLPEDAKIPSKQMVSTEVGKALARDQVLGIAMGSLFFTKKGFEEKKALYKEAAAEFTTPLQSLVMDPDTGTVKVVDKFKEIPSIKTLRQGGWTKENLLGVLKDAKKAAAPSNWKSFMGKIFGLIPAFFRALNKAPAPTPAVPKPSGMIVGFFKMWMKLFKGLIWNGIFGKIMFVVGSAMTIVTTIMQVKSHNAQVDAQKDKSTETKPAQPTKDDKSDA